MYRTLFFKQRSPTHTYTHLHGHEHTKTRLRATHTHIHMGFVWDVHLATPPGCSAASLPLARRVCLVVSRARIFFYYYIFFRPVFAARRRHRLRRSFRFLYRSDWRSRARARARSPGFFSTASPPPSGPVFIVYADGQSHTHRRLPRMFTSRRRRRSRCLRCCRSRAL